MGSASPAIFKPSRRCASIFRAAAFRHYFSPLARPMIVVWTAASDFGFLGFFFFGWLVPGVWTVITWPVLVQSASIVGISCCCCCCREENLRNPDAMGRKKIQISRITDERNRQVRPSLPNATTNSFIDYYSRWSVVSFAQHLSISSQISELRLIQLTWFDNNWMESDGTRRN